VALIVLDASVVIAFLDSSDAHHEAAVSALRAHHADALVLPVSAYAEILVGPLRRGEEAVARVAQFLADLAIRIEPLNADLARRAAALRAQHVFLRLADALVIATAEHMDAAVLLTADRAWSRVSRRVATI
jgi:predicted nucleic acid-binding protein